MPAADPAAAFAPVYAALHAVLEPYAGRLVTVRDGPGDLHVDTAHRQKHGRPLFFAAVQAGASGVSFHLMPVYLRPALLDGVTPALRKRMQGKSCFRFKAVEPALFAELATLVQAGYESYREQGWV